MRRKADGCNGAAARARRRRSVAFACALGALVALAAPASAGAVILYDQFGSDANDGVISTDFSADDPLDSQAADDFVIPAGQTWRIDTVELRSNAASTIPPSFDVRLYSSSGGLPGALVGSAPASAATTTGNDHTITLSSSPTLTSGSYWVAVAANANTTSDPWYWQMRTVQSNNLSAWREPNGGWGTGCTGWGVRSTCTGTTPPDQMFRLTGACCALQTYNVSLAGPGSGTVTSVPSGIDCGPDCSHGFFAGTAVTLTATPTPGSEFVGWSGGNQSSPPCTGTGPCTYTAQGPPQGPRDITATFERLPLRTLSVAKSGAGAGTVTSSPAGIACGPDCNEDFVDGTSVTLSADPAPGSAFAGWSGGGCAGTGQCTTTMTSSTTVTAAFSMVPPPDTEITDVTVKKSKRKKRGKATFEWRAITEPPGSAATFECRLARKTAVPAFGACSSPKTYRKLRPGRYVFSVRAEGDGGPDPTPDQRSFRIKRK